MLSNTCGAIFVGQRMLSNANQCKAMKSNAMQCNAIAMGGVEAATRRRPAENPERAASCLDLHVQFAPQPPRHGVEHKGRLSLGVENKKHTHDL